MSETNELAISQGLYVSPVVGIDDAKSKFEQVREYTAKCLKKGIDYGEIEGVNRPTLLKPGAEKIGSLFGLSPRFECVDKILNFTGTGNPDNEPFFYFEYRCNLFKGEQFIASCDGSCNSWEKKYRYRRGGLRCPNCGRQTLMRSKFGDGFYCNAKRGGCGSNFKKDDPRITSQSIEDVKNMDTAEQVNTFQKMAQKRAYVGAILIACNLSEYYTQDVEDMSDFVQQEYYEGEFTQVPQQEQQPKPVEQKPKKSWNEDEFLAQFTIPDGVPDIGSAAAQTYTDSNDHLYKDMSIRELYSHWMGLAKKIKTENDAQAEVTALKIGAICRLINDEKIKRSIKEPNGGRQDPFVNTGD